MPPWREAALARRERARLVASGSTCTAAPFAAHGDALAELGTRFPGELQRVSLGKCGRIAAALDPRTSESSSTRSRSWAEAASIIST